MELSQFVLTTRTLRQERGRDLPIALGWEVFELELGDVSGMGREGSGSV